MAEDLNVLVEPCSKKGPEPVEPVGNPQLTPFNNAANSIQVGLLDAVIVAGKHIHQNIARPLHLF